MINNNDDIGGEGCGIQNCCMLKKKKMDQKQNGYINNEVIKVFEKFEKLLKLLLIRKIYGVKK